MVSKEIKILIYDMSELRKDINVLKREVASYRNIFSELRKLERFINRVNNRAESNNEWINEFSKILNHPNYIKIMKQKGIIKVK